MNLTQEVKRPLSISEEWQEIFDIARVYCGNGKWTIEMPGTRKTSSGYWTEKHIGYGGGITRENKKNNFIN